MGAGTDGATADVRVTCARSTESVVITGTPPGVRTVAVGDTMTIEVDGLGSLTNPVVAG